MDMVSIKEWVQSKTGEIAMQYGYVIPIVHIRKKEISFGRCYPDIGVIYLNFWFIQQNSEEAVIALIKHEICHLKHKKHDHHFERACNEMWIKKHVWMQCEVIGVTDNDNWHPYECPKCGKLYWYRKKLERKRSCKCEPKYERLVYVGDRKFKGITCEVR